VFGNLWATDLEYDWHGTEPTFCLGPEYLLLRADFQTICQQPPRWNDQPRRALIVMGGSDVNNMTPMAMEQFAGFDGVVDVVVGPGFSNEREIERTAQTVEASFELQYRPENMAQLMHQADLAVSAVGGTVYELLATRTPFVGLPQVEDQDRRADALRRRNYGLIADTEQELASQLEKLLDQPSYRRNQYEAMDGVVDGRGAERVYDAIEAVQ
jgi:spore coat polysaccharide biosynthesis predicted glycosyltransferase SpsG